MKKDIDSDIVNVGCAVATLIVIMTIAVGVSYRILVMAGVIKS